MGDNREAPSSLRGTSQDQAPASGPVSGHLGHLLKGSAIYIVGDLATKLLAFVLIPVYTRYLVPADYGVIEVIKALANGLSIVCVLGLNGALIRYYFDYRDAGDRARFLGATTLVLIGNAFFVVLLFDQFGHGLFERLFPGIPFDPYGRLAIWTIFLTSSSSVILVLYRAREEPGKYIGLQITQSAMGFGLILYFVAVRQNGALGKLQGEFVAAIAAGVVAAYLVRSHIRLSWSWSDAKKSLKFGAPLMPHLIFWWVIDLSDRILLQYYGTLREVGVYSLGYNVAGLMVVFVAGLNNAWAPYFFSMSNRPGAKEILAKLLTYCVCAFLFIGLMLALFARELVVLITTPEYYEAYRVMPIITIAFIFTGLGTILSNLIFYGKTSHQMPLITGLAASVNIGLNVLFIPWFGMMGAAYATLISMAVYACAVLIVSQNAYRIDYERGKLAAIAAAFAILLAIGGEIRFEDVLGTVFLKSCIPVAFALFLWRSGIVRTEDLSILSRRSAVSV